ncbi:Hypothetical protein PHPALM_9887 [Phytophthora palmivora]|uniref:Uncharacterized protein n=1 Tax=Phytophthora palmivora TaxID=4796 RepID=A0A2P4Y645_9STRA|nr:Hypothetical protein PHPALM_9887 [Phytophthora palmivora]
MSRLMRLSSIKFQDGDVEAQSHPSTHPESDKRALPHDGHLMYSTQSIAGRLPDFVAWSGLCKGVLLTMQMTFGYALSVEVMGEDKIPPHRLPEASLVEMFIQKMYHRCLDETKWTKYAPEYYYTLAEVILRDRLARGAYPSEWPELCDVMSDSLNAQETIEIEASDEMIQMRRTTQTMWTRISELAQIENPARGVVSWRRRGILTRFSPVKDVAEKQTPGSRLRSPDD